MKVNFYYFKLNSHKDSFQSGNKPPALSPCCSSPRLMIHRSGETLKCDRKSFSDALSIKSFGAITNKLECSAEVKI